MSPHTLAALAISIFLLLLLCVGDPKRRRTARIKGGEQSSKIRWMLSAAACLPGLYLAGTGDAAAFLIWLGGCSVVGWFVALGFGPSRHDPA